MAQSTVPAQRLSGLRALIAVACLWMAAAVAQPIQRDRGEVRAFRAESPCPATDQVKGACPGWHVDHIIPLCAGAMKKSP